MDDKERFIRQVETKRELHRSITREEKRKEEVLKVFEDPGELVERRIELRILCCGRLATDRREEEGGGLGFSLQRGAIFVANFPEGSCSSPYFG